MEIFISYRRGGGDQAHAGRIHDYLQTLGYRSFYDRDERANRIGEQFPKTLVDALKECKVLIAVIGESWLEQAARLATGEDWVRRELLTVSPPITTHLIPILFAIPPSDWREMILPPALEFVRTANHFAWPGFDNAEKQTLLQELQRVVPEIRPRTQSTNYDRLELLCDRVRAADTFEDAVNERSGSRRPPCWILFGERDEGQAAIFERIDAYTLDSEHYTKRYPVRRMFNLDLNEYRGCQEQEIRGRIIRAVAGEAAGDSYDEMYAQLSRKKIALGVLFSVVYVDTVADARWWIALFQQVRNQLPMLSDTGPQIVLALSISYTERKHAFPLTWLGKRTPLQDFFRSQYPELFGNEASTTARQVNPARSDMRVSRLDSAREDHVRLWCENRYVKPRIMGLPRTEFLGPFQKTPLRPMEDVLDTLQTVLNRRT